MINFFAISGVKTSHLQTIYGIDRENREQRYG